MRIHSLMLGTALCVGITGCGGGGGSGGGGLTGAGPFAGVYDMVLSSTVHFSSPPGTPDESPASPAVFTIGDGTESDLLLTGRSLRTGGVCTIAFDRVSDGTAQMLPSQSCTALFDSSTFKTVSVAGTLALSGNTLTGDVSGDVSGSAGGNDYVGTYTGTWDGTKRP